MLPAWFCLVFLGAPVLAAGMILAGSFGWHPGGWAGVGLLAAWGVFVWFVRNTSFR